ncbi:acrEF/envCD operon transcriptional regulator, partial [Salmonella enterica]|nr:acrEF/envCD operon transcriptional regulator [Salmonella enterica]ECU7443118.1 acrEF/envCD operon transcriptional regulator [Salmonella enterica subsp. enterica serovar Hadar]EHG1952088.1 acrEF/envCD operon transcriptional regulator [Salmonella enterica subsp. enterica serovar Enteritidis]MFI47178.1 acrEF/envCD operon transcriptional regulator [Salmonella enterica]
VLKMLSPDGSVRQLMPNEQQAEEA